MAEHHTRTTRVFISYARSDNEFVRRFVADMKQRLSDIIVFYDEDIEPGENRVARRFAELDRADVILLVLSRAYLESESRWEDLDAANARRADHPDVRLIPIMREHCTPPITLANRAFVDFTGKYKPAFERFVDDWQKIAPTRQDAENEVESETENQAESDLRRIEMLLATGAHDARFWIAEWKCIFITLLAGLVIVDLVVFSYSPANWYVFACHAMTAAFLAWRLIHNELILQEACSGDSR